MHFTRRHRAHPIPALLCLIGLVFGLLSLSLPVRAAKVLTETVDLATIREAAEGDGYYWSNRYKTMTFTNLNMNTKDDYGFRFPSGATLILNGNNVIRASQVAIAGQDTLKIKGSGTLTLIADVGIKMVSPEYTSSLTFMSGKIDMQVGSCGIRSEFPTVIVGNADLTITLSERESGKAIDAYSVMLNSGKLNTNAPIVSANNLSCGACDLTVNATSAALVGRSISMSEGNTVKVGSDAAALQTVDSYGGEQSVKLIPTPSVKTSVLLGKNFPVFWDYLILSLSVLLVIVVIVLPILLKVRRDRIKRAQVEKRRAEEAAARKEAAKAARRAKYAGNKQE